jgi:hypothetical protein
MNKFVHIHSSSRYDRSPAVLSKAAGKYAQDADFLTFTEVATPERKAAVREGLGDEWRSSWGTLPHGADDQGVAWKKDRFKVVYEETFKASDFQYFTTRGNPFPKAAIKIVVLEDRTNGKRFAVGVMHLASSVESWLAKKESTRRTIVWFDSFRNGKSRLNKVAKEHGAVARLFVADFNIDFKKAWARALVKTMAPAYMNTWKNVNVAGGTHGRRIIDATLVRGKMGVKKSAELYEDDASSDHRPYVETLVWL